jgi:hypothetical protein
MHRLGAALIAAAAAYAALEALWRLGPLRWYMKWLRSWAISTS